VAAWNDHEAVRLLGQMMRSGIRVPQDVSIVGYDDLPEGRLIHPTLTTVDTSIERQLLTALELLTNPIQPPFNHSVVVLPTLVCRDSSAPPSSI
jgi:DNA-binding LacI/PurR family transcriptional regulator